MGVMSIRIEDKKRKALKIIASIEGKSLGGLLGELIDDYIVRNKRKLLELSEKDDLTEIMRLSEISFQEWDNDEDKIYDRL
ncbi:MAG: hypothetical protein P9L92_06645 [Candidatus Electryonea clarkiae]|nr:hypothetical protein [Candidatus Electryonea clarkiae]MDP8287875.1 hypothetical protein [Candidatus Electryonea clarkiae]